MDHRVRVRIQPLDIVNNPIFFKVVDELFQIPAKLNRLSLLSERIKSAILDKLHVPDAVQFPDGLFHPYAQVELREERM